MDDFKNVICVTSFDDVVANRISKSSSFEFGTCHSLHFSPTETNITFNVDSDITLSTAAPYTPVTVSGGLIFDYGLPVIVDSCVITLDVEEISNQGFKVFPNPAHDYIIISTLENTGMHSYTITDAIGNLVAEGLINVNETRIELYKLKRGIYFIRIDGLRSINKVIVE